MGRLEGKVAVITGASRGIGAAIARAFAAEGAAVQCLDIDAGGAATTIASELHDAGAGAVRERERALAAVARPARENRDIHA